MCVYRQVIPVDKRRITALQEAAKKHKDLAELLGHFQSRASVYDWGDDPSLFSADYYQGDAACAGWGICRPNVRKHLKPGSVVIFFCARRLTQAEATEYFLVGYGVVKHCIHDRRIIWRPGSRLAAYRKHLNVLVRYESGQVVRHERFPPGHEDWKSRAESPYIVFDPKLSKFNTRSPLHVATSQPGARNEVWIDAPRAQAVHELLFEGFGIKRGLRTSARGSSHPHINLTSHLAAANMSADLLCKRLAAFI